MTRPCERCTRSHKGEYGSGRFCSASCAKQVGAAARKQSVADRARRSAAMVPLPSLPRPMPLPAQIPSSSPGCSSPPRKKPVRSESPTTIAITTAPSSTGNAAALRLRCEGCNAPHDGSYGSGRFCAVHCARRTAAALKWSKKRANRSLQSASQPTTTTTSAPVVASSPVNVVPSSVLPPLPTDDFSLGKRSHAVVAHTSVAPMVHPRSIPYAYGHPCVALPPYAHPHTFVPRFTPAHSYNVQHAHSTLVGSTAPTTLMKCENDGRKQDIQLKATQPGCPVTYPVPVQMPIGVPMTNCYSYASPSVPFGAPYVPVQYGPIGVAPGPQTGICTSERSIISGTTKGGVSGKGTSKPMKIKLKKTITTREERTILRKPIETYERKEEKVKEEDSSATAAAAEMLLSLRNK